MTEPTKAQRALAETRKSKAHTNAVITEAAELFGLIRAHREQNHYAEKLRTIMRGVT